MKAKRYELLQSKLFRYIPHCSVLKSEDARLAAAEGLMSSDPVEAKRWFERLNTQMRFLDRWDDMRPWRKMFPHLCDGRARALQEAPHLAAEAG